MDTTSLVTAAVGVGSASLVGAGTALWKAFSHDPILAAVDRKADAAYDAMTTPQERSDIKAALRVALPVLQSTAEGDAGKLEREALLFVVGEAAKRGASLTAAQLLTAAKEGIAEGPIAAIAQAASQVAAAVAPAKPA